ncbi:hypothetical protein Bca4012_058589 [Brassica carinata]
MSHSRFLKLVLVFVTVASIFSTFAEANRGFGWGWGGGSNYSSSSGSSPGSGWGWGSSRNGSGWSLGAGTNYSSGSGSSPGWGWSWGWGMGSNHSSGSGSSPWSGWGWGWGWGPNNGQNSGFGGSGSGWGWGPKNTNNSGSGRSGSGCGWGGHSKGYNVTYNAPRKIIVGGNKEWTYGFNYSDWAFKTAPFFLSDILVFKYNPPAPFTHSVYLFSNPSSYEKCDVKKGKMIASPKQGAGNGFELVLTKVKPYYISCGEHDGAHCSNGTMKFTVMPILPRWELIIGSLIALGASPGTLNDPNPDFPSGSTPSDLAYANGYKGIAGYLSEYALRAHVSLLSLNEKNVETSLAAVETAPSPSSLALTDFLTAVRNASQAAARIHQVFRAQSFRKKQMKEFGDRKLGMSEECALSMLAPKTHKQGRAHSDDSVQAAAIRIQNKFRGYKGRKEYLITHQRIIKIQAHVRGYQVRKNYRKIIWSVGILEKVILRWRRKGDGLRGFKSDALVTKMQDGTEKLEDNDFFKQGRKQTEERLEKALARVKSMFQYPEARDQYRRLLNVVNDIQESKVEKALANSEEATCFDDDLIDIEALLGDDDTFDDAYVHNLEHLKPLSSLLCEILS